MTRILAAARIASAALTGAASAYTSTSAVAQQQIERVLPGADLSGLSASQLAAVAQEIDNTDGAANKEAAAEALIRAYR